MQKNLLTNPGARLTGFGWTEAFKGRSHFPASLLPFLFYFSLHLLPFLHLCPFSFAQHPPTINLSSSSLLSCFFCSSFPWPSLSLTLPSPPHPGPSLHCLLISLSIPWFLSPSTSSCYSCPRLPPLLHTSCSFLSLPLLCPHCSPGHAWPPFSLMLCLLFFLLPPFILLSP